MKYLFALIIFSTSALAEKQTCEIAGETAEKIMVMRQAHDDVFKTIDEYKSHQDIVLDAYLTPKYDGLKYLSNAINARSAIVRADERRKYYEESNKYKRAVSQFKIKYIKLCLENRDK